MQAASFLPGSSVSIKLGVCKEQQRQKRDEPGGDRGGVWPWRSRWSSLQAPLLIGLALQLSLGVGPTAMQRHRARSHQNGPSTVGVWGQASSGALGTLHCCL